MPRKATVNVQEHVKTVLSDSDVVPLMDAMLDIVKKRMPRPRPRLRDNNVVRLDNEQTLSDILNETKPRRRRRSGFVSQRVNRNYEVLSKWHGARPGTKRARQLDIVLAYTDTRTARAMGAESVDFSYAEEKGLIKFV